MKKIFVGSFKELQEIINDKETLLDLMEEGYYQNNEENRTEEYETLELLFGREW